MDEKEQGIFSVSIKKKGRPKKFIPDKPPEEVVYLLAKAGATQEEIALELDIDVDTLRNHPELYEYWKHGVNHIKLNLRQIQIKSALEGNITAQIWLGKQLLGQRDKYEIVEDKPKIDIAARLAELNRELASNE